MIETIDQCNAALGRLLAATLKHEAAIAQRDKEILAIQKQYAPAIATAFDQTVALEFQVTQYCLDHRKEIETGGKKSLQLANGVIGFRAPTNPALIPLNEKWTWEKIAEKVKELWKKKYFHKPKPPGLDKMGLKKNLDAKQLAQCGMKLDDEEQFYLELNRLADADQAASRSAA